MKDAVLHAYHRLPPAARDATATAFGLWLRAWRQGREARAYQAEACAREGWDADRWDRWCRFRLDEVLERAATTVPYYRRYWEHRPTDAWKDLERWPILTKDAVREQPERFVADDRSRWRLYREHTSGSTGKPLTLWWDRRTVQRWYALHAARVLEWHGLERSDPWAMLGGQLVVAVDRTDPPFWVWNASLRQLYMSSYHLAPQTARAYAEEMRRRGVRYLLGYPSSLTSLASFCLERGVRAPRVTAAICNAEPLYDHQRSMITEAFGCRVVDTYGMAEIVMAASECPEGRSHLWPEVGVVEVLDDGDEPVPSGTVGRLVCTGLLNEASMLVRYDVGDVGALDEGATCRCGRTLPLVAGLEGRSDDMVRLRDGRRVGRLDPVFKSDLAIREAQIVQDSIDVVRIRLVPAVGYDDGVGEAVVRRLADRLGDVHVEVEIVDRIERTAAGKFRAVISHVEERDDA